MNEVKYCRYPMITNATNYTIMQLITRSFVLLLDSLNDDDDLSMFLIEECYEKSHSKKS